MPHREHKLEHQWRPAFAILISKAHAIADAWMPHAGKWLKMFQACTLVVRGDIQTCLFLLPYVIQNAVGHGQDAARADIMAEVTAVLSSGHATREGELCVQAVFTLLDVLRAWLEQRKLASAPVTSSGA